MLHDMGDVDREPERMSDADFIMYANQFNEYSEQEKLYQFIKCIAENWECYDDCIMHTAVIDNFISRGASMFYLTYYLMENKYTYDPAKVRWEIKPIEFKMMLLDYYWDDLDKDYINDILSTWKNIKPTHWSDIPEGTNIMNAHRAFMKYRSKMLNGGKYAPRKKGYDI